MLQPVSNYRSNVNNQLQQKKEKIQSLQNPLAKSQKIKHQSQNLALARKKLALKKPAHKKPVRKKPARNPVKVLSIEEIKGFQETIYYNLIPYQSQLIIQI